MEDLEKRWRELVLSLEKNINDKLSLKSILFLIGVQELGQGVRSFDKEEKLYLLHIATCKLLIPFGYYRFKSIDEDGWPHFEEVKKLERLGASSQKNLMKRAILKYFE